jgi:predicted RNase H-like HicB family nuclease
VALFLAIELEREADNRWIAEIPTLPGVLAYGADADAAIARVESLALRVIADEIDNGERSPVELSLSFVRPAA